MTPKERAAMQQALEAVHNSANALLFLARDCEMRNSAVDDCNKAITALREALAEQAEQEPVYAFRRKGQDSFCTCDKQRYEELADKPNLFEVTTFYATPVQKTEQEPDVVGAYEVWDKDEQVFTLVYPQAIHKYNLIPEESITRTFYAAPVRTKDLTDDEIDDIILFNMPIESPRTFARAVIQEFRRKNDLI